MTYTEALAYLNSFINYENKNTYSYRKSFKLERIQDFLELIGNPQEALQCLHIAGTKGKGSVCIFIASILREAGYSVGLYTSPHLMDVRERIRVLRKTKDERRKTKDEFEGMISKKEITHLVERVKPLIEKYQRVSKYGDLTFFEVYTALAFMYFKEQRVDYAVLETGLGGRLDATNVVDPLVCGITPISYDHMDLLGKSLAKIAKEKAGIIKRDEGRGTKDDRYGNSLIVISAAQKKEARAVIKKRCLKEKARLYEVGKDIVWRLGRIKGEWQSFEVRGLKRKYTGLKIKLLGEHQLDNASLAIGMAEALEDKRLSPHVIKRGLMSASWPGRLEIAGRKPTIILDGAQNTASAFTLKEALKKYYTYQKLILVLGISSDKDIEGVCAMLEDIADKVILTKAWNPRAEEPESIKKYIGKPLEVTSDVKKAIVLAKYLAGSKDLILITGSLFVVGEARKIILKAVTNS
ncbi:MAG: hypothetical protein A2Y00_10130 [Omnitrophica WOR_2 bacterium GWF2_43_52]|nr:MAG: hypothetical protein A2Y01_02485 [Omnitrophica WOR_2 bacterium GWC2_44_8]OGX21587.1 MAG: hypothetical protein A2Y00_10130 [Omnitrophica WOR_2 bacterium GWF2_43_52]HAH19474.1 bifunctional folylpolyglutamate synthase/dihydrofolate synthase [Candidatus Omnitrophota bacterium]HBG63845.1 bifunctional folylpolyglutamate synthase/dihydrofolate synthase [Candidatus Omnitrophota bacterium]